MPLPEPVEMLRQLVALPSVSSVNPAFDQGNGEVVALLANWLEDLGFAVRTLALADHPHKLNLIATRGSGPGGLVLAGHTDTVPYDDDGWGGDPFRLEQRDGRFYGLGTSDMKGFFPLALEAIRRSDREPAAPLVVLATADEESSMAGARALGDGDHVPGRYAVIGEPTGMAPVRMHKGVMMYAVRVRGRSGHSSDPDLGRNALEGMHRVIGALLAWRATLQERFSDPSFAVAVPTMNLGHIHGGDNPNRICAECELQIDLRVLPQMMLEEIVAELNTCVAAALAGTDFAFEVIPLMPAVPAFGTAADAEIVKLAEQLTGRACGAAAFASEAPFLNALGMETILLGPGDIEVAHQPDEYLPVDRMEATVQILGRLITHFCRC